jgi:hypothetical protein
MRRVRNRKKRYMAMRERREGVIRMTMIQEGMMPLRFHVQGRFGVVDLRIYGYDKIYVPDNCPKRGVAARSRYKTFVSESDVEDF